MNGNTRDAELMGQLLTLIATASAIGADALRASSGDHQLLDLWLTNAATGFSQAAVAGPLLAKIELTDEWRRRVEAFLRQTIPSRT